MLILEASLYSGRAVIVLVHMDARNRYTVDLPPPPPIVSYPFERLSSASLTVSRNSKQGYQSGGGGLTHTAYWWPLHPGSSDSPSLSSERLSWLSSLLTLGFLNLLCLLDCCPSRVWRWLQFSSIPVPTCTYPSTYVYSVSYYSTLYTYILYSAFMQLY